MHAGSNQIWDFVSLTLPPTPPTPFSTPPGPLPCEILYGESVCVCVNYLSQKFVSSLYSLQLLYVWENCACVCLWGGGGGIGYKCKREGGNYCTFVKERSKTSNRREIDMYIIIWQSRMLVRWIAIVTPVSVCLIHCSVTRVSASDEMLSQCVPWIVELLVPVCQMNCQVTLEKKVESACLMNCWVTRVSESDELLNDNRADVSDEWLSHDRGCVSYDLQS